MNLLLFYAGLKWSQFSGHAEAFMQNVFLFAPHEANVTYAHKPECQRKIPTYKNTVFFSLEGTI